jgi:hypothetical protein
MTREGWLSGPSGTGPELPVFPADIEKPGHLPRFL